MDTSTQRNSRSAPGQPTCPKHPQSAVRLLFWCCRTPTAGIIGRLTVLLVDSELAAVSDNTAARGAGNAIAAQCHDRTA